MKKNIAKIVVGLPIDSTFDYLVPKTLVDRIKIGCRVWVPFKYRKLVGYVVGFDSLSKFKKIKSIISLIDEEPIFDKNYLKFLKDFNVYYCCSLGEAVETSLPPDLKNGGEINLKRTGEYRKEKNNSKGMLIHDISGQKRWEIILKEIQDCLNVNGGVVFLVPEVSDIASVLKKLKEFGIKEDISILNRQQSQKNQTMEWQKVKNGVSNIVVGTRSAIFAPLKNLKLIIIDEEEGSSYKQEQMPFYQTRDVAFMRAKFMNTNLILTSVTPSVESYHLAKKNKFKFVILKNEEKPPEIKLIDMANYSYQQRRKNAAISLPLEENMRRVLTERGRVILFINRKGFSNIIRCRNCNFTLKCKRCNVSLTYHFDKKKLLCRFCNYQTQPPELCPECRSSYMRYSGMGTEKLESEVNRLFPDKKILRLDKETRTISDKFDILITTQIILKSYSLILADLVGVIAIDSALNRLDFRAAEKTFSLLIKLSMLAKQRTIVQTYNPKHYSVFSAAKKDFDYFYKEELKLRRSLKFPPFRHFTSVMLRGKNLEAVKDFSLSLFENLNKFNKTKSIEIFQPMPDIPDKLRGTFRWHILFKGKDVKKINQLIKDGLKRQKRKSGIIVGVNVDI